VRYTCLLVRTGTPLAAVAGQPVSCLWPVTKIFQIKYITLKCSYAKSLVFWPNRLMCLTGTVYYWSIRLLFRAPTENAASLQMTAISTWLKQDHRSGYASAILKSCCPSPHHINGTNVANIVTSNLCLSAQVVTFVMEAMTQIGMGFMKVILLFALYSTTSSSCHKLLPSPPVGWLNSLLSPGCRNTKFPMNNRIMWISWGGATSVRRAKRFANAATKCSDKCLVELRKFISCRKKWHKFDSRKLKCFIITVPVSHFLIYF
jgi:hypothetical protein